MTIRERTEQFEEEKLSQYASLSKNAKRILPHTPCEIRTAYQQDRDKIIHSKAFRRLKHKTQVFIAPKRDHYRTRLTHTLEVAQIARTISRALLLNEDLTEAIALAHDLGHTPFGHSGEEALCNVSSINFKHYEQSVRVVKRLENNLKGLNLTCEVYDGILNHTCGKLPYTLEGQVVRISDRIAYINHDIDDAIRANVLKEDAIPKKITELLGFNRSQRINTLVLSIVKNSSGNVLKMEDSIQKAFDILHSFMFEKVYMNSYAKSEETKIPNMIKQLYTYFKNDYKKMPKILQKIALEEGIDRAVCDYVAGMTDSFAVEIFKNIFIPKAWNV